MKKLTFFKKVFSVIICILFSSNNVFALNAATDLIDHTSVVNPTTTGNVTNITTTHNIDTYHWSSFSLAGNETANYIFTANGQTALNYLSPGANASVIYGAITGSGASGNILLFNPNGIMMGGGASVSGANTFFASTNKFDGIVNGKVTFSEAEKNNPLTVGNIKFNDVNNVHFVAPNVSVNADNITTNNSVSVRAIGGGEYDVNSNLFSNETAVKNPIADTNILDVNANIESNKVTIEAKTDSEAYAKAVISGDIKANKAVTGENGEVYIIASNDNSSSAAGMQVVQNATISGDSAKVDINAQNLVQNGDIDVSGANGGTVNINTKSLEQNSNICANGTSGVGGEVSIKTTDYNATSNATINASGTNKGGNISIIGDNQIITYGTYKVSSSSGGGGTVIISAPTTKLFDANIDASGYTEGGNVYIGGPGTSNESILTILSKDSEINASSLNGKGGNVYLDSAGDTFAYGKINTSGVGENGGYIELSGDKYLAINPDNIIFGKGGALYLDPKYITISDSGSTTTTSDNYDSYSDSGSSSLTLSNATLATWLASGSVTLAANDDITIASAITAAGISGKTLTLNAGRSLFVNANITTGNANLTILANDPSATGRETGIAEIKMTAGTKIDAGTGNVLITISNAGDNGNITLGDITANIINIYNNGSTLAHTITGSSGSNIILNGALKATSTGTNETDCSHISTLYGDITQSLGATLSTQNDLYLSAGFDGTTQGNITLDQGIECFGQVYIPWAYNAWVFGLTNLRMGNVNVMNNLYLNAFGILTTGNISQCDSKSIKVGNNFTAIAKGSIFQGASDSITVGNDLTFKTTNGNIYQGTGSYISVNNDTKINTTGTGTGSITLSNSGNDFCQNGAGQVYIGTSSNKAASASLIDANLIKLGDIYTSGALTINALNGNITECAKKDISVGTDMTLNATSGNISQEAGIIGDNTTISVGNDLIMTTTGTKTISQGSNATIAVNNDTKINTTGSGTGSVTLDNSGNDFCKNLTGQVYIGTTANKAASASITDANLIKLGNIDTSGDLTINTINGDITECARKDITVGTDMTLNAINGNISQEGGIIGDNTLITVGHDLIMTTTGTKTISQVVNSNIAVNNDTKINTTGTGTGAITLSSSNNYFCQNGTGQIYIGTSSNKAASASLANAILMKLGDIYTSGQLAVVANNGDITECSKKDIVVGGNLVLYTPHGGIVQEAGIGSDNTTITVGGDLLITANGANAVSQGGNATVAVYKDTKINTAGTGTGSISLSNSGNDFCQNGTGQVYIGTASNKAASASLTDANLIKLGNINVSGKLDVTANTGDIVQCASTAINVDGEMDLTATNGGISQTDPTGTQTAPTMTVGGNTKLMAKNVIDLSQEGNDFIGPVTITSAYNATIYDKNNLTMGSSTVNNDLLLLAGAGGGTGNLSVGTTNVVNDLSLAANNGNITQTGIITQSSSSGSTNIGSGTDSSNYILLNNSGNDFTGPVSTISAPVISAHDVTIYDKNSIIIGPTAVNGNYIVHANNSSTVGATASTITTTGSVTAGGNVELLLLDNNSNAGSITIDNNITAQNILIHNQSTTTNTNVNLNAILEAQGSSANASPLVVCSDAGDFINTAGSGALLVDQTALGQRWLVYTGSPADTILDNLTPANTYYSSTIYNPTPENVPAGNSVLYRTPNPNPGGGGGGGGGATGGIVGGTVGGAAAAGVAAGTASGLGLLPGLLLGLASPIQFDETMLDILCASTKDYPLLTRNMQYVYQIDDICKLDEVKTGSAKFIPDGPINNGTYELVKVKIPQKFVNSPKGLTVRITQKSNPFGISKNTPDMNFNVFNTLSDKGIGKLYETRRFLKPKYLSPRVATISNRQVYPNSGIVQKTILVKPGETKADLSIAVNYLKNGQFPRKNSPARLDKQVYSFVIQFIENK